MKKLFMTIIFLSAMPYGTCSFADESSTIGLKDVNAALGKYSCSFTVDIGNEPYTYPQFRCVIENRGDHYILEKLSGSQRIKGNINFDSKGFSFDGIYFCPDGECTSHVTGHFEKLKTGTYRGVICDPAEPNNKTTVDLQKK